MTTPEVRQAVGATDVGRRNHNEDALLIQPENGLVLVADGVGGHHAGEVASAITCDTVASEISAGSTLQEAVRSANRAVMAAVESGNGKRGMASTVVAAHINGAEYELAWVGDSRAYLWDGSLKLLTRDHSLIERLLASGEISRDEVRDHPQRNVIVQAIGLQSEENLRVDSNRGSLSEGSVLLLCSDGMSDVLENKRIVEILAEDLPLRERCDKLVKTSIDNGGKDNSTVILVPGCGEPLAGSVEPKVVWNFDPATGETTGASEVAPRSPTLRKVVPKAAADPADSPQTTQMMSVAEVEAALASRNQAGADDGPVETVPASASRWVLGIIAASAVLGAIALYALG